MTSTTRQRTTPLFTAAFARLCLSGVAYFGGLNLIVAVLPVFVESDLGGTSTQVGLSVGSFGLAAAVVRPLVGPVADRRGRRLLVTGGAVLAGVATAATALAGSIPAVVAVRVLAGLGEAAFFVGLATAVQDISPPDRRGEAASYFSLTIYGSLALAPPVGEWLAEARGTDSVWLVAGALALVGAAFGLSAPGRPPTAPASRREGWLHPAALRPGFVLFCGLLGYAGFLSFAALHADAVGIANTGTVFTLFAVVVVVLRLGAARLPDALGPRRTTTIALTAAAVALTLLSVWRSPTGVYVGTTLLAVGQTFLFPALFVLAVDRAPADERAHAVGSFSMAFDLAFGAGGPLIGLVADATDLATGFAVSALTSIVALILARRLLDDVEPPALSVAELGPRGRR